MNSRASPRQQHQILHEAAQPVGLPVEHPGNTRQVVRVDLAAVEPLGIPPDRRQWVRKS